MLIVMCGRKVSRLGGQDRRWLKVSEILINKYCATSIINKSYYELAQKTEFELGENYVIINENSQKYINYIKLNLSVIRHGFMHKEVHYCAHALEMTPSAIVIKYLLRKRISFSFNGVSVNYLKSEGQWKSVFLLRVMSLICDKIELLNPALLDENFFDKRKLFFSKPMYAGKEIVRNKNRDYKKIVFAGHLYALKGVDLLFKIIESCENNEYQFYIYGGNFGDSSKTQDWAKKLENFNNVHFMSHVNDMSQVYADALVVLSLQTISNYPSQVVLEGLAAGASVVMTDVGDTRQFGDCAGIFYFDSVFNRRNYWETIERAAKFSIENSELIANSCLKKFNAESYADNFYKNLILVN